MPKFYQSFDEFAPKQKYRGSHSVYFHPHDFLHTHRASQLCGGVFRGRVGLRAREMVGERGGEEGGVCALQTGLLCLRCQKRGIEIMPKWTQEKKFDEKKEQKMKVRNCWARDSKKKRIKETFVYEPSSLGPFPPWIAWNYYWVKTHREKYVYYTYCGWTKLFFIYLKVISFLPSYFFTLFFDHLHFYFSFLFSLLILNPSRRWFR